MIKVTASKERANSFPTCGYFFSPADYLCKSAEDKKSMQNYPACKEFKVNFMFKNHVLYTLLHELATIYNIQSLKKIIFQILDVNPPLFPK